MGKNVPREALFSILTNRLTYKEVRLEDYSVLSSVVTEG